MRKAKTFPIAAAALLVGAMIASPVWMAQAQQPPRGYPAREGTVAWWHFDEDGGCAAFDATPNGNDGTLRPDCPDNAPRRTIGRIGSALDFDGEDDYVSLPSQPVSDLIGDQFTIEFWVNPGGTPDRPTFGWFDSGLGNINNPIASYDTLLSMSRGYGNSRGRKGVSKES